ncbi:hypothetical protein EJ03DRAFT_390177 [Teratosphaeria nubilosa]|uniref:DUF3818 domain-containing protein n=1 Tax=Teratosphaeria nubilosa TaxID=161662 RepID=A0A6G1L506_9PEZI|nr:hypothetical protein EJ03DRAFT_390177 [Teratosphaeria nubilosa]
MAADGATLTPEQSHALFDILTHRETYGEIEDFKYPDAINNYGPPFQDHVKKSQSPILQTLVSKFALKLPGLRDVSPEFWKVRVEDLVKELADAELSESYDKGVLGIRKTLATAISALIEYPARGCLEGVHTDLPDKSKQYNVDNPDDVLQSWRDALQLMVYGDLIDELFAKAAETDDLSKHSSLVQAMHEFVVVNIASLMHYTLVLSPEGPTLLRMIQSVHNMLPYVVIRQTLKIGNVASMISAMMRVILTKASVASMTNWIGLTSGADEGMNLLQQIISQVLGWDKRELRKRAEKIEKDKDAPPKEVREELKDWMGRSRAEHDECRRQSREQQVSIVSVIMAMSSHSTELSEKQHANALEYLALHLAIRDRQQIVKVLCKRNPDHLTAAIKDAVDAYTPMIRHVHQAVNLSDTIWDFERFVTDMLKIAKPSGAKGEEKPPSVEDFVDLLHRHQSSSHKFLHQFAKNGKEVTGWWQDYVHYAAAQFKQGGNPPPSDLAVPEDVATAGGVMKGIEKAFADLSKDDQEVVKKELSAYSKYLDDLHSASAARVSAVIKRTHSTPYGPGAYLARWQHLMDTTLITPGTAKGPLYTPVEHGTSPRPQGRYPVSISSTA